jgi:peptidyl-prolyl cis-trans isomerase SurA
MLKLPVRLVLVCLVFVSPCVSQTAKAHPSSDDSVQDRICLSEVLIRTLPSDTAAQVTEALHKAEGLRRAVQTGSSFADLAKANSGGPTAAQGGSIGCFKRGTLSKQLEELVFRLQRGEMSDVSDVSDVLRTKQGWVILQVTERSPR